MNKKIKVIENSFLYTFSSILVKAVNFLLLPVYTLFLTPHDYGIINIINSFKSVAVYIIAFSLYSCINRFYVEYKDDNKKLKRLWGTLCTFVFISGVIFILLGFLFRKAIISWFFDGIPFYPHIVISLLSLLFICLYTIYQSILEAMQLGRKLILVNILMFIFQIALNIILIGAFKLGAQGVLLASLIIYFAYVIYMMVDLYSHNMIVIGIDREILRETLKYSIPIMPHDLSTHIANFTSRLFINKNDSLSTVGLYSTAWQFGVIIDTVQSSVNAAFTPWFFEIKNSGNESEKKEIINLSQLLLILYSLMYIAIGLFSQEVLFIFTNEQYSMAWTVVPIIVTAFSIKSIYYFYINLLLYDKKAAKMVSVSTLTGSFADIIFASMLVPRYGMYGAAVSFLVAKIIVVVIVVIMGRKCNDVGYRVSHMLSIVIPSILFMYCGLFFSYTKFMSSFSWWNLLYKVVIMSGYFLYLYLINKDRIKEVLKSRKIKEIIVSRFKR